MTFMPQYAAAGFANPMTTAGDLIDGGTAGAAQRLPIGSASQVLTVTAGAPAWANNPAGFADPMTTQGDIIIEDSSPAPARLPIGTAGQLLGIAAGEPAWVANAFLTPTAVKTSAYTASPGDFVPVDTTSAAVTVTLPAAPADKTLIGVKQVTRGGTNTVTVAAGSGDHFNTAGGATSATLTVQGQATLVEYNAALAVWYIIASDTPLGQLDSRYLQDANNLSDLASRQTALNNIAGAVTNHDMLAGDGTNITVRALAAADLPTGTTSAQGALQLDGTAADIQPLGSQAAGAVGKAADAGHIHPAVGNQTPADQGMLAWAWDIGSVANSSATALATGGTLYTVSMRLGKAQSITNIVSFLSANGSVLTSGQCFAALYQGFGGALLGVTADQSAAWGSGATKALTMPIAGGPVPVAAGIVVVAVWFQGTVGPAFWRTNGTLAAMNIGLAAAASRWGTADTGITTTAPPTLGTVSAAGVAYWMGLS